MTYVNVVRQPHGHPETTQVPGSTPFGQVRGTTWQAAAEWDVQRGEAVLDAGCDAGHAEHLGRDKMFRYVPVESNCPCRFIVQAYLAEGRLPRFLIQ